MWTVTRQYKTGGLRIVEVTNSEPSIDMLPACYLKEYKHFEDKAEAVEVAENICKLWTKDTHNMPGYAPQIRFKEVEEKESKQPIEEEESEPVEEEVPAVDEEPVVEEPVVEEEPVFEPVVEEEPVPEKKTRVRRRHA